MNINTDITMLKIKFAKATPTPINSTVKTDEDAKRYNKKLKDASDGFEELFVHQLLKEMRKTIPKTNLLDGGRGEEIFQDMLDEDYAKIITKSGALGLSDVIYESNKKPVKDTEPAQVTRDNYRR